MAYKVSQDVISLFKSCYRQIAKIQVLGVEGLDEINESDIVQGGLTVDRYCFSSNSLEIGTAIASELSLELKNDKGQFDSFSFDGVKLVARIGIKKWDAKSWENAVIHYLPLGVFTVDEPIKNKATVTLNALDNMVKFDKPYDTDLIFPATLAEIAEDACSKCGVLLQTTSFYNSDYYVSSRPTDEELTYRQVIQWIAQLSCTNAFIDWDGQLRFAWFEDTGIIIPPSDRYDSDLEEDSVLITGVKVVTTDDSEYTAGSDDCIFVIEGNSLAQSNPEFIASMIYAQLENFSYRPYSCECRPMPYLFPMDMITFVDTKGNSHSTIVSAVTYTMNGSTDVLGEGDGQTKGGYASTGSLTQHERVIIEKAKKAAEKTSTEQFNLVLALNQTISSAFGLYQSEVIENGASTWYYHDQPTIDDSTIIYVFNSGGFAWTDDWNNGNPVWQYGFTKDGNALYKILSAYKIQAEYIDANTITADKIKAGAIGGFIIDETHIGKNMTSYDDTEHDTGVFISTEGIGLGGGKFYVTDQGYFHAETGEFSGNILGGSININDKFKVDSSGNVTLNGNIIWGTGASPTQVVYAQTSLTKPNDSTDWSSFPASSSSAWHTTYSSSDYFASFTYDGGKTWGEPIIIRGIDGTNGTNGKNGSDGSDGSDGSTIQIVYLYYRKSSSTAPSTPSYSGGTIPSGWSLTPTGVTSYYKYEFVSQCTVTDGSYGSWSTPVIWAKYGADGSDGSDASVTDENVFNALTSNGTMYGCFTALDSKLYINAAYIRAGTVSSDITFTGKLVADDADISGNITATSGRIGNWYIGVNDGYIRSATGVYGTYNWTTTGADYISATGYRFVAITELGFMYVLKSGSDYDNSATIYVGSSLNSSSGSSSAGSGGTIYV